MKNRSAQRSFSFLTERLRDLDPVFDSVTYVSERRTVIGA
jgi:hypothetical protein